MGKRIGAIVLAAGASIRMGRPKQLLPFGRSTILQTVVDTALASQALETVCVVVGHGAAQVTDSLADRPVLVRVNQAPDGGMFSSLLCGLRALPGTVSGLMVMLGDQPRVSPGIIGQVVRAYRESGKGIIIPTHNGRRGHPTLIDLVRYRARIEALDGRQGLKPVVRGYPEDTLTTEVGEPGVLEDIDTPEDYERALRCLDRARQSDTNP